MLQIEVIWCSPFFRIPVQCSQIDEYHSTLDKATKESKVDHWNLLVLRMVVLKLPCQKLLIS
jgi:hypothetical protein